MSTTSPSAVQQAQTLSLLAACCVVAISALNAKDLSAVIRQHLLLQRWRCFLHVFIKKTQWEMPHKRATKGDEHAPILAIVLRRITLLADSIVLDVYWTTQACDHRLSLNLRCHSACCLIGFLVVASTCQLAKWQKGVQGHSKCTLDFGTINGTCSALVQSLKALTASLISLDRKPRRISGGSCEGSQLSEGAGLFLTTCSQRFGLLCYSHRAIDAQLVDTAYHACLGTSRASLKWHLASALAVS